MLNVNRMLDAAASGEQQAAEEFFRVVYDDLRRLAGRYLDGERAGQTLQPTALVHEAYLRLLGAAPGSPPLANRRAFYAAAARAMRHILVESARRRNSLKRGGDRSREAIDPDRIAEPEIADDLLALHEALDALAKAEPAIAELVTLRYFGGMTVREAAEVLGVAPRTADAHWAYARAWLSVAIQNAQD
jgi:RNA polymerase sigma factor (TIGR02999 family)